MKVLHTHKSRFTPSLSSRASPQSTMSDDDRDIDVESDDGEDSDSRQPSSSRQSGGQYYTQADKRAHHNALERKRRDHIKDSFTDLRLSVPSLSGEKVASRAQILKKAAEYIVFMRKKNSSHQKDIQLLKRQNGLLEHQISSLEQMKITGLGMEAMNINARGPNDHDTESDTSDMEEAVQRRRPKKLKTGSYH